MTFRLATLNDCPLLAAMNRQLLEDEGHRNRFMTVLQLEERMRGWLSGEYRAVIFEEGGHGPNAFEKIPHGKALSTAG